jgi:hypothetical protein
MTVIDVGVTSEGSPHVMDAEGGDPCSHPVLGYSVEADQVVLEEEPPAPQG